MKYYKSLGIATMVGITDAEGKPYPEDDWRAAYLLRTGPLALYKSERGDWCYAAQVYVDGSYIKTSKVEELTEDETHIRIRTTHSAYVFEKTDTEEEIDNLSKQ